MLTRLYIGKRIAATIPPATIARTTINIGSIEVEIAFTEGVPASARPELNVDAQIFTASLKDVLFIERPMNAQSHANVSVFKLLDNNKSAKLQDLGFGEDAGKFIQIKKGAQEKDRFILSDMTSMQDANTIQIVD